MNLEINNSVLEKDIKLIFFALNPEFILVLEYVKTLILLQPSFWAYDRP